MPSAYVERMQEQQIRIAEERKARLKAQKERIAAFRAATYSGSKYKPNAQDTELIGIQDAVLFWASESGVDNSTDDSGNSGLHKTTFDTTTYADQAQIKLLNDSGATQYIRAVAIKGKPVTRESNALGWTHDSFVDHQDIFYNGENSFEFGNNYVVAKDQLENLTDYYAKALGALQGNAASPKNKHIYVLSIPGRNWHFEPGEWVVVQMGSSGEKEYIDSVCEIYNVSVESSAGDLGTTVVSLREVEENWTKDSNAVARYMSAGDPKWKPNNLGRVVVAARDYLGVADYYCDGTADQTEIQAAIDYLAGTFDGGVVDLTEGQYNVTAAIECKSNIMLWGRGAKCIIEKNCNDYALEIVGTSNTAKENICISDIHFKTNSADTYSKDAIYITYGSNIKIQECYFTDIYSYSVEITDNCTNSILVAKCTFTNCSLNGNAVISASYRCSLIDNVFYSNRNTSPTIHGPVFAAAGTLIQGNKIYNNWGEGITPASEAEIFNNYVSNNAQFNNAAIRSGIDIVSGGWENILVNSNYCVNNGSLIAYGQCESTDAPYIINDASSLSGCTIARSTVQKYAGSYSQKLTKTSTSTAEYRLCDNVNKNDLHTMVAGQQYALSAYTYLLATGSPKTTEVCLVIGYTTSTAGAWNEITATPSTGKDAWYVCQTTNVALATGIKGAKALVRIAAAASTGEAIYIDNVRLQPVGITNRHSQNYKNSGTNTFASGNSWQSTGAST